jgi:oligopeptidase A
VANNETNPLLAGGYRIPFHRIGAEHVEPAVREALADARAEVDRISEDPAAPTWANTMDRLDAAVELLAERIAPVTHLVSVAETPELREAYNAVLPRITAFWSRLPLDEALWSRVKAYASTPEAQALTGLQKRHLDKTVREFQRAGADLSPAAKARLEQVRIELAQLEQTFSEHVLDATATYELPIADASRLDGIPESARRRARERAKETGRSGWLLTLDYPSVEPILKYCRDRELRREIFVAYTTRCRDGEYDNRPLLARILRLRDELAGILGYESFPDYTLEDRMAGSGHGATSFETDLVERTRPYWQRDVAELRAHAATLGLAGVEPWDAAFVMEDLRRSRYHIDDETLRPYFPLPKVLDGLFEIVRRTFGFRIDERKIPEVWHPDVRYFEIYDDAEGTLLGGFYTDWFPRAEKRQGAWMNHFVTGGPRAARFAPHLGVICGNFTQPAYSGFGRSATIPHNPFRTCIYPYRVAIRK